MSGIYIKGVKLPKRCGLCGWYSLPDVGCLVDSKNRVIKVKDALNGRPDWCPLIEVPEHGDLIEREPLEKKVRLLNAHYSYREVVEYADIHFAPTIIPADMEG